MFSILCIENKFSVAEKHSVTMLTQNLVSESTETNIFKSGAFNKIAKLSNHSLGIIFEREGNKMSGTISSQSLSLSSTVNDMSINKPTDLPGSRPKRLVLEARARIRQWTDKTTIHGLPQIVFGKQIIFRLIWVLLFLAATAITIIMVTQSVVKYFEYEVVTVMQYEQETSIVFPQITSIL